MIKFIHNIRKKPTEVKAHISFLVAFITVVIIALLWILTLPTKFAELQKINERNISAREAEEAEKRAADEESSEMILSDVFRQFTSSTTEIVGDLGESLKSLQEVSGSEQNSTEQGNNIIIKEIP